MNKIIASNAILLFTFAVLCASASAQEEKGKRPSPPAGADCTLAAGKTIHVDYSSPRMKGRKIYGGLVPWGQIWRTGANEATTFVISADVIVGGKEVPAGSYTLFTIPNEDKWTLIISKKTKQDNSDKPLSGIPYPGEQFELTRADMQVLRIDYSPVEDFTISFDNSGGACTLRMDWENTRASITISPK
jgi:DUF2911 family protein